MGRLTTPKPVKLVVGLLAKETELIKTVRARLGNLFGPEEDILPPMPFTWTNFYQREIGKQPWRCFIAYEKLIQRESIREIKRQTNDLEQEFAQDKLRPINIDPGYLTLGQFFLATTKDQRQRVYVGRGIFVEVTLFFKNGAYHPFDWTYRDYSSQEYRTYFESVRSKYAYQLKSGIPHSQRKARKTPQ